MKPLFLDRLLEKNGRQWPPGWRSRLEKHFIFPDATKQDPLGGVCRRVTICWINSFPDQTSAVSFCEWTGSPESSPASPGALRPKNRPLCNQACINRQKSPQKYQRSTDTPTSQEQRNQRGFKIGQPLFTPLRRTFQV